MKKLYKLLVLMMVMAIGFTGCANNSDKTNSNEKTESKKIQKQKKITKSASVVHLLWHLLSARFLQLLSKRM